MNEETFEALIKQSEGEYLDFKLEPYFANIEKERKKDKNADFIKDIISFSNTVRDRTAYIIIGIDQQKSDNVLVGIDPSIIDDNASTQQKIKDKVYPIPKFKLYPFYYKEKCFQIIEVPVTWYSSPILATENMKGIDRRQVYIRRDSTNAEATPDEVHKLSIWFDELKNGVYKVQPVTTKTKSTTFRTPSLRNQNYPSSEKTIPFSEGNIQRLFGSEAAEDERTERLEEYYFKNDIYSKVDVDLPVRILVGHKGIGKSALFKIAISEDKTIGKVPILIRPDDIAELGKNSEDFLQIIRDWKIGLSEIIVKLATNYFGIKINTPLRDLLLERKNIIEVIIDIINIGLQEHDIDEKTNSLIINFLKVQTINVYIDDLDRGWLGGKKDIIRISALLNAVRDITNESYGLQFKISLRSDVFFLVRTSDESTDKIQSSVVWYSWTNHEILIMLIKRVRTFLDRPVEEDRLKELSQRQIAGYLDPIIEPTFNGIGKWEKAPVYRILMTMIRKRPRDIVKLLTLAARKANNRKANAINTIDLQASFEEYSQDRIQDTINEYKSELPNIGKLLFGMKPSAKSKYTFDNYVFSRDELMKKINNIMSMNNFLFADGQKQTQKNWLNFYIK